MIGNRDTALGLYISIPFCRSKCTYCNFASGVYPASQHQRYVDRVVEDLRAADAWAAQMGVELPRRVDTVYMGGGTPSLLAPELLRKLFDAMRAEFDLEPDAEITVECAPGQLSAETLDAMVAAGLLGMGGDRTEAVLTEPDSPARGTRCYSAHTQQLQHRFAPRHALRRAHCFFRLAFGFPGHDISPAQTSIK